MKISTTLFLVALTANPITSLASTSQLSGAQKAIAAYQSDNYDQAKSLWQQQPKSVQKSLYLGKIAYQQSKLEDAEEYFEEALEQDEVNAEAHYMLGSVSMELAANASMFSAASYAATAKESLIKAIEIEPTHVDAMVSLAQFYVYAPSIVGGDIDKAEGLAMQLAKYSKLDSLLVTQMVLSKKDAKEELMKLSKQLLNEFSNSSEAVLIAGFIYQELEHYDEAFQAFDKSSLLAREDKEDLSPEYALFQLGKTSVLSESRLELGVNALERYIGLEESMAVPNTDWARYRLAQLRNLQGDKKQALEIAATLKAATEDDDLEEQLSDFIKEVKKS